MSDYTTDGKGQNTMGKKLQPKLRFRGFTDAWEQRKGAEVICVRRDNIANPPKDIVDVELENLIEGGGLQGDLSLRTASTSVFHEHDTLFGRLRPYLRKFWFANTSGVKSGEIWSLYSSALKPEFLYALTQSAQFLNQALQTAGTKMPRAEWKTIAEAYFAVPQAEEQEKIGILFQKLEQLIDAEKRKLELLEKKREELLQCVFSQRLRLNGCTEDCPQYSLAELEMNGDIHMGRGKVISAIQMKKNPGIYPVYSSSSKNNGEMGRYGEYMFDHELVTWSIDGGGHVFYRAKHRFSITNVCGYIQVRNNIDCSFLAYQMMFKHSKLHFDYTSKALPSLIKNMYDLSMPSLYEQERIGRLFKVFDSLIEFISHKIELTEQKKKALLQTMFL
ncbi:restriction endonuclease subunit S [Bifidobacterium pseudolongum]|uniref:restriction endonuclease subunit S n=1 Tax=Bifidobacterium pseudolongum TaxID=1694 RepID=UPI0013EC8081|nr:restriction endonuclease subunit S [Bifidobacterium pseudolongum]